MSDPNENGPRVQPRPVVFSQKNQPSNAGKSILLRGDKQGGEAVSDRELLAFAAKAAGIRINHWVYDDLDYSPAVLEAGGTWHPLADDGDALRLAVKLGLCVSACEKRKDTMVGYSLEDKGYNLMEDWDADPYAATRRAIVRAAAEIGRNMK